MFVVNNSDVKWIFNRTRVTNINGDNCLVCSSKLVNNEIRKYYYYTGPTLNYLLCSHHNLNSLTQHLKAFRKTLTNNLCRRFCALLQA